MIQKFSTQELRNKSRIIRLKSESEFIIEVNNETESRTILSTKKLSNVDVRITERTQINQSKGKYTSTTTMFQTQTLKAIVKI